MLFSVSFAFQLKIVQHKAKEKLESGMLQTVILDKDEFSWFKKNKEISIGGKLFDVKSFFQQNGKYIFRGLYDHEETALNQILNRSQKERTKLILTGIFQSLFSSHSSQFPELTTINDITTTNFPLILQHRPFPFQEILTPPPQLVLL